MRQGLEPGQLIVRLVEEYLAQEVAQASVATWPGQAEQHEKIARDQQAYEAQHAALFAQYKGQYIAMHQGKVIDHDLDRVALSRRIDKRYGQIAILITQVREEPWLTIHLRSPRLVKTKP
jgi:hypothetical protein